MIDGAAELPRSASFGRPDPVLVLVHEDEDGDGNTENRGDFEPT